MSTNTKTVWFNSNCLVFPPSDPLQNSVRWVAVYSAPRVGSHNSDAHYFRRHHHPHATDNCQEDAGRWTEGADSSKNCSSRGNNSTEYVAALLSSSSGANDQYQRGPGSGSSCYNHQCRRWADDSFISRKILKAIGKEHFRQGALLIICKAK